MTGAREAILARIRQGLPPREGDEPALRLSRHRRNLQPARIALPKDALVELFVDKALGVQATVARVASADDVPSEIARYLRSRNLPAEVAIAPHPDLDAMDWTGGTITATRRGPLESDRCGVNRVYGAVAETGTLMMASGPDSPATMNFLPETHVAVLRECDISGAAEDVWDRLRAQGRASAGCLPRTVNMITGVSRTGDIEQTIQTGVHGPRFLHIVLVKET